MAVAAGLLALLPGGEGKGEEHSAPPSARLQGMRVAVVGVDGADWDLMQPLIERGELPHFAALRERGAWGSLETLEPTLSPALWTSMVTGKLPRRHGIHDFTTRRLRGVMESLPDLRPLNRLGFPFLFARLEAADQMFEAPITSFTRRVPAFWNIAAARGSPVNVINWWGTWPAEPVVGEIVSERAYYHELVHRGKPQRLSGLTHPDELYPQIAPLIALPDDVTLAEAREFMDVSAEEFEQMRVRRPGAAGIENEFTYFHSMFTTNQRLALDAMERSRRRFGETGDLLVLFRLVDKTSHATLDSRSSSRSTGRLRATLSGGTEGWSAARIARSTAPSGGSRRLSETATSWSCPITASSWRARKATTTPRLRRGSSWRPGPLSAPDVSKGFRSWT